MKSVFILECFNCATGHFVVLDFVFKSRQSAENFQRDLLDEYYVTCERTKTPWRVSDYVFAILERTLLD